MPEPPAPARSRFGDVTTVLGIVAGAAALYAIFVPITAIGTKFDNLDERTLRMERDVKAQIENLDRTTKEQNRNLDVTLQREYRMSAERLDSVAERATKDISELKETVRKLQEEVHALSVNAARQQGGK